MSSRGNNGIWINEHTKTEWQIHYNTVYGKNIVKRPESQVKLHRIIIKVHKIICSARTKISTPAIFFDQHQTFVAPHDPHDRSSRLQMLFKRNILRNFTRISLENTCVGVSFSKSCRPEGLQPLLKGDHNTDVFLWYLWKFWEPLFLRNTSGGCFWHDPCHPRCLTDS